ncbi:MAG: DUF4102 domain-containing protein [Proteobacteria bacterium]|nr:DUF4102 domain-containing protein [Pseudomonadota bacterium]
MFNDTQCKQAKAGKKPLKLSEEKGLYLLIATAGAKYWRMDYRFAGKRKTLALGVYPEALLKRVFHGVVEHWIAPDNKTPGRARRCSKNVT